MGISKQDTAVAAALALLLIGGKKALASTGKKAPSADEDGAKLLARANQKAALAWADLFQGVPTTPMTAAALARWAGIESSGDPTAHSRLNERGLLQAGAQTVAEGGMSQKDWDALISPATANSEHAALGVHYAQWLFSKASHYITNPPDDPVDQVWYAKLYHQRPMDLKNEALDDGALQSARLLAIRWANDPKAMHRLRAANVVAWNDPNP